MWYNTTRWYTPGMAWTINCVPFKKSGRADPVPDYLRLMNKCKEGGADAVRGFNPTCHWSIPSDMKLISSRLSVTKAARRLPTSSVSVYKEFDNEDPAQLVVFCKTAKCNIYEWVPFRNFIRPYNISLSSIEKLTAVGTRNSCLSPPHSWERLRSSTPLTSWNFWGRSANITLRPSSHSPSTTYPVHRNLHSSFPFTIPVASREKLPVASIT